MFLASLLGSDNAKDSPPRRPPQLMIFASLLVSLNNAGKTKCGRKTMITRESNTMHAEISPTKIYCALTNKIKNINFSLELDYSLPLIHHLRLWMIFYSMWITNMYVYLHGCVHGCFHDCFHDCLHVFVRSSVQNKFAYVHTF